VTTGLNTRTILKVGTAIDDLRHLGRSWKNALPVLLKWLPIVRHLGVKEGIVRGNIQVTPGKGL
jgi:hypothetical protein